jgi:hypothetical protein
VRVNAALAPLLELVGSLLHECELAGALAPGEAPVRTRLLWASLHGLGHFRKRDRGEPPANRVDALVPELLRTLLLGWGAPPKAVGALLPRR